MNEENNPIDINLKAMVTKSNELALSFLNKGNIKTLILSPQHYASLKI